ncbi:hypothetical protein [Bosea sp. BK604]|uniref:hypothetical protein n=1 Tax=Bosea sp. BK604 TaxID=2512180 RepID=UPI0010496880|nr:hypothetical protein [Bosea sp. BK604]TCR70280.1 hypothetical protein EV560_101686 [Bosea sp. BK604]
MKSGKRPPPKPTSGAPADADISLREQGRQWFAEARAQSARDAGETDAWNRRRWNGRDGAGPAGSPGTDGGEGETNGK